jgi:Amt family ammonium transporter
VIPYPSWLNAGDNAWQMTAATLVGLMSIPALAVLYGGLVQKKWAMNTVLMVFTTFGLVLITWVLWGFKLGFGTPLVHTFIGDPRTILGASAEESQASIPLVNAAVPAWHLPGASVEYFQFVFAAITPILFIGSVLGRISFKVWMVFVPLWITFAYCVNAFLLWGGGYWAGKGALDFSGGYVIHLAAGVSGFTAAAIIGLSRTTCCSSRSAPASCGSAGTASTAVTRTSPARTPRPRCSTPTWPPRAPCWSGSSWT